MTHDASLGAKGQAIRTRLQGDAFVSAQRNKDDPLWQAFQDLVDEMYGSTWTRPALSLRERSLITVAVLAAAGHPQELKRHLIAAGRNGISPSELKELALQLTLYCGLPVVVGLWRQIDELASDPERS